MLGLCGACAQAPPERPADSSGPPNVIIVLVDTLRADHMSLYGYDRETTPFIDLLADDSVVFNRARSQSACTFPSVNSMLTSRYAFDFYREQSKGMGIPDQYPTLAQILRAHGYRTVAVSASPIVRDTPSKENPAGGFGAGFDVFDEKCLWNNAECVNGRTLKHMKKLEEPFFLYLHYMDPHGHYTPPESYTKQFAGPYEGHDFIAAGDTGPIEDMLFADGPRVDITDRDIQHLIDLYDDEIRYFDGVFRRLLAMLDARHQLEGTLIVLTSDHGEEFLEHGHVKHCRGLWNNLTHVPLVLQIPRAGEGRVIDAAVENIDIVPTILDYLGIDFRGFGFKGSSLRPLIEGRSTESRYAFADVGRYRSADDGRFHLILDALDTRFTLFDLSNDPLEQRDLFDSPHPEFTPLLDALDNWLDATGQRSGLDDAVAEAHAKEEELRALGYLE